jgi:hypothetical protein
VYLFTNGTVKLANKRFTTVKNDFTLVFEKNASITEAEDDGSIAGLDSAFDFVPIKEIEDKGSHQRSVDVIGVIIEL